MADITLRHTLPVWVEPDPLRGRAVDALGLQATADRIANEILPGLSVLTTRARYYSVLAWARQACGAHVDEHRVHRIEVALAVRESQLHAGENSDEGKQDARCKFVGSRNLAGPRFAVPPPDPHDAYRVPVWRAYRASMRSLGLLNPDDSLTDNGARLAKHFAAACRPRDASGKTMLPEEACLSEMGREEGALLEKALGIGKKGRLGDEDPSPATRRAALERELRDKRLFDDGLEVSRVLSVYETRRDRTPSRTVAALREAAVWERLSVGLNALFLLWLYHIERPLKAKRIILAARRVRPTFPEPFSDIPIDEQAAKYAARSIRRALKLRDRLAHSDALRHCDEAAFELGESVVSGLPVEEVLGGLEARHIREKQDDAWLRDGRRGKELARDPDEKWKLPANATLHGYRLGAFGSLLADLQRARRART